MSVNRHSLRDRLRVLSRCFFCILCLLIIVVNPDASKGEETADKSPEIISPIPQAAADEITQPAEEDAIKPETIAAPPTVVPDTQEQPGEAPAQLSPSPQGGEGQGEGIGEEALPLPAQEGTVSIPLEAAESPRGLLTRINEAFLKKIEYRGYLKNETAYRYVSPPAFTKILNILQLEPSYSLNSDVRLSARLWAYYDLAYDLQDLGTIAPMKAFDFIEPPAPGEPDPDIKNLRKIKVDHYGLDLKEIYVDVFLSKMDFRIGKQIIRWGIVEGWRILDEVNPLDFTEHILRDVADRYIPLWMVKADYYIGPYTVEGLWIPDVKGHKPAPLRSEWSQFQTLPDLKKVPRNFKNSEGGLRFSGSIKGYEFAVAYLNQWDDFPAAFRSVSGLGLGTLGISPDVKFFPVYRRLQSYGVGLAKSLGKVVLEGEFAYVDGKYWGTCTECTGPEIVFGEKQRDYIKHVVGVKTVLYGADISVNFSQDIILNHTSDIQQDGHENAASIFARKEIRYGTMVPQLLVISLLNRHEYLFRPKLEYRYTDKVTFLFGVDVFSGDPGPDPGRLNFFGYFDDDDRVYMEVKYSF